MAEHDDEVAEERAIVLALDGETHTLGNTLRDVMWAHPHVELASYTQEHPSINEIILRCQTSTAISAEQGVVEALQMTKSILQHMAGTMDGAATAWAARSTGGGGSRAPRGQQQQQQQQLEGEEGEQEGDEGGEEMDEDDS